jgi:hypothetical protein
VLSSFRVTESLGQAEVDNVHIVLFLADSDQEIVWLNVSVKEMTGVYELDSLKLFKF